MGKTAMIPSLPHFPSIGLDLLFVLSLFSLVSFDCFCVLIWCDYLLLPGLLELLLPFSTLLSFLPLSSSNTLYPHTQTHLSTHSLLIPLHRSAIQITSTQCQAACTLLPQCSSNGPSSPHNLISSPAQADMASSPCPVC